MPTVRFPGRDSKAVTLNKLGRPFARTRTTLQSTVPPSLEYVHVLL